MTNQTNSQVPLLPDPRRPIPPAPVHPLAALVTIVLDNVFGVFEFIDPLAILVTSVGVGMLGTISTTLVQRYLAKDSWGASIAKGLVMGIIAGVPFPVTGTAVGVPLLAWAGLHEWVKLPGPKGKQPAIPAVPLADDQNIVDGEVREVK
jgi:hypothetical protein